MKNYEIQNLRAIAILLILLGHMPFQVPDFLAHGYSYVSLFLAISGFYMASGFMKKHTDGKRNIHDGKSILKRESLNRFLRLFPLMWIWIAIYVLTAFLVTVLGGSYGTLSRWLHELFSAFFLYYNYYLAPLSIGGLFGQYWTLFVEIHFFIIALAAFILIRNKKGKIIFSVIILALTVLLLRPLTPVNEVRFVTHAQLDSLFTGVLIGLCFDPDKPVKAFRRSKYLNMLMGAVLCFLLFAAGWFFDNYCNLMYLKYPVYTLLSALILLLALRNQGFFSFGILQRPLTWIGDCSASIYVSHVILFSCIYFNIYEYTGIIPDRIKYSGWGMVIQILFLTAAAIAVGRLSYRVIEKPFGRLSKKIAEKG